VPILLKENVSAVLGKVSVIPTPETRTLPPACVDERVVDVVIET
jgi:hypothetical protein